jgi:pyrimidine deaminase RibD-like protein
MPSIISLLRSAVVTEPFGPEADRRWLLEAISLSRRCTPSQTAYSVGAVLVAADGRVLSTGFSRETGPGVHAEEVALARFGLTGAAVRTELPGATLYSSLEPCAVRASRPVPCADLIIVSGIGRVVIAWTEPPVLAPGGGAERMRAAGLEVVEIPELAAAARQVNMHLLVRGATVARGATPDPAQGEPPAGSGG